MVSCTSADVSPSRGWDCGTRQQHKQALVRTHQGMPDNDTGCAAESAHHHRVPQRICVLGEKAVVIMFSLAHRGAQPETRAVATLKRRLRWEKRETRRAQRAVCVCSSGSGSLTRARSLPPACTPPRQPECRDSRCAREAALVVNTKKSETGRRRASLKGQQ